jgi:hypothetical protein
VTSRTLRLVMLAALSAAAAFASAPVCAHEYWLQADNYHPAPGERLVVHLDMGESLAAQEEMAYEVERTERFELRSADDVRNLAASTPEGLKPVFADTLSSEGAFLLTLVRGSAPTEISAEEFNQFLDREGIVGPRVQQATQRERSWRFLKLLGRSGADNETDLHHRFTGAQFEIVLLQNPFTQQLGEEQIVQLLFDTKPLAGATVFALHRGADGALTKLSAVTDARGVVRFKLDQPGMWLVRSAHLRPCKGCKDADWESFSAAYSFALE